MATDHVVLDTDVASALQAGALAAAERDLIEGKTLATTFVTVAEFYKGAYKRRWGERRIGEYERWLRRLVVLPYDAGVAREWGRISSDGEAIGRPIAPNDAWIAACCRRHDVPLMTHNRRHFESISNLTLVP